MSPLNRTAGDSLHLFVAVVFGMSIAAALGAGLYLALWDGCSCDSSRLHLFLLNIDKNAATAFMGASVAVSVITFMLLVFVDFNPGRTSYVVQKARERARLRAAGISKSPPSDRTWVSEEEMLAAVKRKQARDAAAKKDDEILRRAIAAGKV